MFINMDFDKIGGLEIFTPHIFGLCILAGLLGFVLLGFFSVWSGFLTGQVPSFLVANVILFFLFTISLNIPMILCCKAETPEASKLVSQY